MKPKPLFLSLGLLATLTTGCTTMERAGGGTVEVVFQNPEQFTDMTRTESQQGADADYLRELERHIQRVGSSRIGGGQTLAITITDVDMAGDFEPERGPDFYDIRVVKTIYPPRINLTFRLTDAAGNVLAEGERQLRNPEFNWTASPIDRGDPLRHEKELVDGFLRGLPRA